jgi:hypothetical protein
LQKSGGMLPFLVEIFTSLLVKFIRILEEDVKKIVCDLSIFGSMEPLCGFKKGVDLTKSRVDQRFLLIISLF